MSLKCNRPKGQMSLKSTRPEMLKNEVEKNGYFLPKKCIKNGGVFYPCFYVFVSQSCVTPLCYSQKLVV